MYDLLGLERKSEFKYCPSLVVGSVMMGEGWGIFLMAYNFIFRRRFEISKDSLPLYEGAREQAR
jgi:hypothetical protein